MPRRMTVPEKPEQLHGLLVLNKPKGPTSTRCLEKIKRVCGQKKIGHAGTLDPMAQGVLLVLLGQGTKIAQYLTEGGKIYSGEMELGKATDTYDAEGEVTAESPWEHITQEQVAAEVLAWEQLKSQPVPPYSAAKHKGEPLYKLSREGKTPPVKTKAVKISRAEVTFTDLPRVGFRVECGVGTYIRSLVHSLGIRLGCGAMLTQLTREQSHPFSLDEAHSLEGILEDPMSLPDKVLSMERALPHWPRLTLSKPQALSVKNGGQLGYGPNLAPTRNFAEGQRALFLDPEGSPLALVESRLTEGKAVWGILRGLWQS